MPPLKMTQKDYVDMLLKLEKNGRSGFGNLGHAALVVLGGAGGYFAAPVIAAIAGANAVPVVSWLASLAGYSLMAATPVGWVAGCVAGGALLCGGVGAIVRLGGRHDEKRQMLRENIIERIRKYREIYPQISDEEQFKNIMYILKIAYYKVSENKEGGIAIDDGIKIIAGLKEKSITPIQALDYCEALVTKRIASLG